MADARVSPCPPEPVFTRTLFYREELCLGLLEATSFSQVRQTRQKMASKHESSAGAVEATLKDKDGLELSYNGPDDIPFLVSRFQILGFQWDA